MAATPQRRPSELNAGSVEMDAADENSAIANNPDTAMDPAAWRDEIVRTIFGDVGAIRRDFSCAIERKILLHGRLYITERFICFYSNLFGFEKKIKIPYSHVSCVTKENTAVFIPNAIAVITARKEYVFRSFWDRDECFNLLRAFHEMYRTVVEPAGTVDEYGPAAAAKEAAGGPEKKKDDDAKADDVVFDRVTGDTPPRSPDLPAAPAPAPAAVSKPRPAAQPPKAAVVMQRVESEARRTRPPTPDVADTPEHARSAAASFRAHVRSTELKWVLKECVLPVSIDAFFGHFLADGCGFPLMEYHKRQGDLDISATNWQASDHPGEHDREVRFKKIMGGVGRPPSARTTKVQRCRAFGRHGLVLHGVYSMEDIPYRDCFVIHDRWVVEPADDAGAKTKIRFELDIKWSKSTIFKRKIESSSKSDLEAFYDGYASDTAAYLATAGKVKEAAVVAAAPPPAPVVVAASETWTLDRALPWCLVAGLFYLLLLQRSTQGAILAELAALRGEVAALAAAR